MKPDTSRTEADAAHHAAILGRSEWIGDGGETGPDPLLDEPDARLRPDPWGLPASKPTTPPGLPAEPPF